MSTPEPSPQAQLYAALSLAQAEVGAAGKSGRNSHGKYSYSDANDLLAAAKPALAAHGLALAPGEIKRLDVTVGQTNRGDPRQQVYLIWAWSVIHEGGGRWDFEVAGCGFDNGDKAVYKAKTGAQKYAVRTALGLACLDDPEHDPRATTKPSDDALKAAYDRGHKEGSQANLKTIAAARTEATRYALTEADADDWPRKEFQDALTEAGISHPVGDVVRFCLWLGKRSPRHMSDAHVEQMLRWMPTPGGQSKWADFERFNALD